MAAKDTERARLDKYLGRMEAALRNLFGESYAKVMQIHDVRKAVKDGQEFTWKENPAAQRAAEKTLGDLANGASVLIANGVTGAYRAGVNAATDKVAGQYKGEQSQQAAKVMEAATKSHRTAALIGKAGEGQDITKRTSPLLSGRVWSISDQSLAELEIIIQNGIKEGRSADEMAAEAQKYLNEPDRLFRRVRNKETGLYELSEAARNYHPGRGVYRSSFKNAMRLIRTEVNAAYRLAEWESYQRNPLVKQYRISLSGNHTTTTTSGRIVELHDICDDMAGVYPKTFKWTGWHPQCRCVMTPVVMTPAEFSAYLKAKHDGEEENPDKGGELPEQTREWLRKNADRVNAAWAKGRLPRWMQDNDTLIRRPSILEAAKARQAARTPEEVAAIKRAWLRRARLRRFLALDASNQKRYLLNVYNSRTTTMQNVYAECAAVRKAYNDLCEELLGHSVVDLYKSLRRKRADRSSLKEFDPNKAFSLAEDLRESLNSFREESLKSLRQRYGKEWKKVVGKDARADLEKAKDWDGFVNKSRSNPDYESVLPPSEFKSYRLYKAQFKMPHHINCQTCVVAHQMRRKGWDVVAKGNTKGSLSEKLSTHTAAAWIDPKTGAEIVQRTAFGIEVTPSQTYNFYLLNKTKKRGSMGILLTNFHSLTSRPGAYSIQFGWKSGGGHIISFERFKDGTYRMYDPQRPQNAKNSWTSDAELKGYFKDVSLNREGYHVGITITPLQNVVINPDYMSILRCP